MYSDMPNAPSSYLDIFSNTSDNKHVLHKSMCPARLPPRSSLVAHHPERGHARLLPRLV